MITLDHKSARHAMLLKRMIDGHAAFMEILNEQLDVFLSDQNVRIAGTEPAPSGAHEPEEQVPLRIKDLDLNGPGSAKRKYKSKYNAAAGQATHSRRMLLARYFQNHPNWTVTAAIVQEMFRENGIRINPGNAGMFLADLTKRGIVTRKGTGLYGVTSAQLDALIRKYMGDALSAPEDVATAS